MKKILIPILVFYINPTFASENSWSSNFTPSDFSASLSSGLLLKSKAKEFVYVDDPEVGKISQLNWDTNSANIINAEVNWQFHPRVSLNARGWTTLSKNSSIMDDYDWMAEDRNLVTDWSHHDDTSLNYANEFDINLNLNLVDTPYYTFGAVLGYQQNRYSWLARGGTYHYSSTDEEGYIDGTALANIGEFTPGSKGIGYQQKFKMPYIGIHNKFEYNKFEFNALLKYSNWVQASDFDEHYKENATFYTKANDGTYYGAILNVGYNIRPDTKLFTEYSWSEYKLVTTDSKKIEHKTNETTYSKNGGGISNKSQNLSFGIKYTF